MSKYLYFIILSIPSLTFINCQREKFFEKIIFSEVYLDRFDQDKNWIELYNPTRTTLLMSGGRFYHIKTTNCLPSFQRK